MPHSETLEEGDIFFLYRPTVDVEHPTNLDEVQHLYVVLRPRGRGAALRLLVIGKKRLPASGDHDRNWGFVEQVAATPAEIEEPLRAQTYETKTRGIRTQGAARPAGEGVYALNKGGAESHLLYALELPADPGPVQDALGIARAAAFSVSVKNPDPASGNTGMLEGTDPRYSKREASRFHGNRWTPAEPALLDHKGAEFLLIPIHDDALAELAPQTPADPSRAHSLTTLRMARTRHPVEPLFTGEWA